MARTIATIVVFVLLAINARPETQTSISNVGNFTVEESLIYDSKIGGKMLGSRLSPDKLTIAVVTEKKGRQAVWTEKYGLSEYYPSVLGLFFSSDGQRFAFLAKDDGDVTHVFVDGKSVGTYREILNNELLFSDDGKDLLFVIRGTTPGKADNKTSGSNMTVIVNGIAGQEYSSILSLDPEAPTQLLASEGGRLVYFARSGDEHFAVIDGLEGPKFEETGFGPVFSDDYAHVAYAGMRDSSWYIVVDSVEHGPYPAVSYVDFPPGSAEPGYIVEWPDSSRIYLNHQPQATPFKLVRQPVYTVEGALWYFWASDGKRTYVVSGDGQVTNEDLEYYSVSTPWRSAHGNHCVYEMVFDSDFTRKAFVVDGVLQTRIECGGNYTIGFSNDGSHYYTSCFISYPMEATLSVDDTHGPYRGIWIDPVTFSEDSKRWATRVVAKDGPYLVIDGRNVPVEASCSSVHFSQDGRHLAYTISRKKSSEEHLVIDDTDFKAYTEILGEELTFGADGTLTVFARHKDSKLYRVTVSPLSAP